MWRTEATGEFEKWWSGLPEDVQDSISTAVRLLQEFGPNLPFPYSSQIKGSRLSRMRELRVQHRGKPYRVLYAFDPQRVAVLLAGGLKTGVAWYKEIVPRAERAYERHLRDQE